MTESMELWYPNHHLNPGILSKLIKEEIDTKFHNFGLEIVNTYFSSDEAFLIDIDFHEENYIEYIKSEIYKKYGQFNRLSNIHEEQTTLGRLVSPGKVGFGIFTDIGIRSKNKPNDILLPLFQLREDLGLEDKSLREIVTTMGMVTSFPLEVEIVKIEGSKINAALSSDTVDRYERWRDGKDKLIITKTFHYEVERAIDQQGFSKYISHVEVLDPLTTVVHCLSKTRGSGLLPKLGAKLSQSPIGILRSSK